MELIVPVASSILVHSFLLNDSACAIFTRLSIGPVEALNSLTIGWEVQMENCGVMLSHIVRKYLLSAQVRKLPLFRGTL